MRVVLSNASVKWGGVHVITETLARGLTTRGHDVTIFGAPASLLQQRMKDVVPFEPILSGMDLHPLALWRAHDALRRHRTEIVLAMMRKDVRLTVPAARARRIPSIVRHANDRPLAGWVYDRVFFGNLPSAHIANSQSTKRTLLASAPWLDEVKVSVIYNGIDPLAIESATPAELNLPAGSLAIGFAGRLETRKGLFDLLHAWPRVAEEIGNAHLIIAGTGGDEEHGRRVAAGLPRVHWLGYRADVPSVLRALHILAVPSHWEGFGLIAAEASLAGLPVVAANASSLPEIVLDGITGLLVPPGHPDALAMALIALGRDPDRRTRMGHEGRARALRDFKAERMVDDYEELMLRLLAEVASQKRKSRPPQSA